MGKYTEAVKRGGDEWYNCVDVETCYREPEQNSREYQIARQGVLDREYVRMMRRVRASLDPPPQPAPWSRVLDALRRFVASSAR